MADNTKIGPIFRGANGGLSDDLFTGIRNSFYYSNDMEIREDAKSVYPKPVPAYADASTRVQIAVSNYDEVSCVFFSDADNAWIICAGDKIYSVTNAGVTTLLATLPEKICDAEIFNGYVYVTTRQYVYYCLNNSYYRDDMEAATTDAQLNYGRCTQTLHDASTHPLYASDVCLCVGDTYAMWKITREIPNALQAGLEVQKSYVIRFIHELGGYIRAVAVDEPYGSEILLWDKISLAPTEVIPLEGYSIIGAAIYGGYHYLLSNKGLGLLNGYQYYLLKRVSGNVDTTVRNCMSVYDDKLYFIANNGIYIYGAKNKNYADVLNLWHKVENGYTLGAIGSYKDGIMITRNPLYKSGGTYEPICLGINEGKSTIGEIQTMCYFGTSMSEIKQSMYIRVGYHIANVTTLGGVNYQGSLKVYYRTEADAKSNNVDSWVWHELTPQNGLKPSSDMRSPFATSLKLNCRFQWIQFKFVLENVNETIGDITYKQDTNLYSADLYYNDMLD